MKPRKLTRAEKVQIKVVGHRVVSGARYLHFEVLSSVLKDGFITLNHAHPDRVDTFDHYPLDDAKIDFEDGELDVAVYSYPSPAERDDRELELNLYVKIEHGRVVSVKE